MILTDLLGSEIQKGDLVAVQQAFVVGQIVQIDSGQIARGVSISGPAPQGEMRPPVVVVQIQMTAAQAAGLDGKFPGLLKLHKPEVDKNKIQE